ncbi:hypothetical protein Ccrd_012458 [Cynara cardunculus var. scolymus]|uniref:Uncharacterized protein n=1 Tax=Cynara cardunculus var. scolymus TaxID=59895 RepID=A0A118K5K1_CYNCS|nr:hypothetical protein Ccrd_012458 [Cynara cardunculus var. scolymus]
MLCSPTADSFINHPAPPSTSTKTWMEPTRIPSLTLYMLSPLTNPSEGKGINMACTGISYQRLRNEGGGDDNEKEKEKDYEKEIEREINQIKARIRFRWSLRLKKVHIRKKLKMKIPSLRKFMRRKARVVMASLSKVLRRLKESQSHLGDLFAGNYMFIQVTPTPLKSSSIKYQGRSG